MNYYDNLNKLIDTIEKNLETPINYNELAKIIGTSAYAMQRIFVFLTGITLTEYIRKRRLSKAAEELKRTNHKIIDIAIKYQYDSPVSFTNAFKKMYGKSPASFRKNDLPLTFFPKMEFSPSVKGKKEMQYRIVEMPSRTFYGKTTGIMKEENKKAIRDLYKQIKTDGSKKFIIDNSNGKELYYGIYQPIFDKSEYTGNGKYYVVGKTPREDFVEITMPKAKWACFRVPNHNQTDILKLNSSIYGTWLPQTEYYLISKYRGI